MTEPAQPRRFTPRYFWRLLRFGLLAFVVIVLGVMTWMSKIQVDDYLRRAPSTVTIPPDLPFTPETVTFTGGPDATTKKWLTLAGWFVPPQNGATVILLHGYGGNRMQLRRQAEWLFAAGYGLLLYDERGSGESEGTLRSYGWQDVEDTGGALDFLRGRPEVDMNRIGLLGCSMGAMIGIRSAARYPEIRAVIADGPGVVASGDLPPPVSWADWLSVIPNWMIDRMMEARLGMAQPPLVSEVINQIEPRPLLLIAGGQNLAVLNGALGNEARHVGRYLQFAGDHAELWVIDEATHCDGPWQRPDDYRQRILDFFADGLQPDPQPET